MEKILKITKFHQLHCWQEARQLVILIYQMSAHFPKSEMFGITSQIRRAATSITANIAEGFERHSGKDKCKFYGYARASTAEVQSFLLISKDLTFLEERTYEDLYKRCVLIMRLVNGLMLSIERVHANKRS